MELMMKTNMNIMLLTLLLGTGLQCPLNAAEPSTDSLDFLDPLFDLMAEEALPDAFSQAPSPSMDMPPQPTAVPVVAAAAQQNYLYSCSYADIGDNLFARFVGLPDSNIIPMAPPAAPVAAAAD